MDDKNKNTKKDSVETASDTAKCKFNAHWKIIAGVIVLAIILLNTFWNMMESKISETMAKNESFKSELAALGARLSEAEKGTIDLDAVKADVASIKKAGEDFEKKLLAVINAEELKLAGLEKEAANQKAYIEELKNLLEGIK